MMETRKKDSEVRALCFDFRSKTICRIGRKLKEQKAAASFPSGGRENGEKHAPLEVRFYAHVHLGHVGATEAEVSFVHCSTPSQC